ncbi:MAG: DoxX family protein [Patescibacteria group bacterium]|nr:DoxX family protein [Patescibacteria group bacterium]
MRPWSDVFAPIIGRILVGGFFLWNGIAETLNFPSTALLVQTRGLPEPLLIAGLLITIEVLGGIALVVGFKMRQAALILVIFTIAAAFLYSDFSNNLYIQLFLENMAVVGGLLYISAKERPSR